MMVVIGEPVDIAALLREHEGRGTQNEAAPAPRRAGAPGLDASNLTAVLADAAAHGVKCGVEAHPGFFTAWFLSDAQGRSPRSFNSTVGAALWLYENTRA